MAANSSMDLKRNQMIVSSLCQHFSLDPKPYMGEVAENEVKTLYSNIVKSSGKESSLKNSNEVLKWVEFAENFPSDASSCLGVLGKLNEELVSKSVLLGQGLRPSEADVIVFSALHSSVLSLSDSDKETLPHVMRWMDYIQNKEGLGNLFGLISVKKPDFEHQARTATKVEADPNTNKTVQISQISEKSESVPSAKKNDSKKGDTVKKASGDKKATQEKKKAPEVEAAAADKDKELSVSLLNIKVGLINKAWKHPSADSLLVEEIDVGEAKFRQVVSGLAKYCSPEELTNRRVVLITNVKPGKLRDVVSEGLVLCASSEDHTSVEPLLVPEGAIPGERVSFSGIDGKPEDVLNPKKKQLDKITPNLFTDEKGVATFKGIPFMTSAGPCTSSIPKATIK